ncbi:hypothetical protein C2845_PM02G21700 [Panicum miliaceum]|uniref:Uncharacterized protein n=1 Tax=Panicum miliaceum TaxID=4540 RepID=A0A3L6S7U8_PANMI|nr:hypothetical protein C2845_PM02G21700 [Panicum miliaceum]
MTDPPSRLCAGCHLSPGGHHRGLSPSPLYRCGTPLPPCADGHAGPGDHPGPTSALVPRPAATPIPGVPPSPAPSPRELVVECMPASPGLSPDARPFYPGGSSADRPKELR